MIFTKLFCVGSRDTNIQLVENKKEASKIGFGPAGPQRFGSNVLDLEARWTYVTGHVTPTEIFLEFLQLPPP